MRKTYKIFLVIFIIFTGFNLYAIDWKSGITDKENLPFLISLSSGIIGLILVFVLHIWSKISSKQ
jgi:TRAP-type C4-dicarboxylate transport system permease small subunit